MYISFDYRCDNCKRTVGRLVYKDTMDSQTCCICHKPMRKLMAAPRTTFRFNDKKLKP